MAIKFATVYGIPLYVDYSWFIIFVLIVWTVGFDLMPASYPHLSTLEYLSIGLASALLLFASILVHELAHSIVAERSGIKIGRITLFLFGGVSEMEAQPGTADLELKVAAAGPLTSILIAVVCSGGWLFSETARAPILVQAPLQYTALVNAIVAGFNLIPAFPMDGGRIFRAFLWRWNRNLIRSTRIASTVGRIFSYLIIVGGVIVLFFSLFEGLWLILIGWFISTGASAEMNQLIIQRDLAQLRARDIMTRNVDAVNPDISLEELSVKFHEQRHNGFPVMAGDEIVGCVTMADLRRVKREEWSALKVGDIMTPKEKLVTVEENDSAQRVLALMNSNRIGRIFVLGSADGSSGSQSNKPLVGIITRSDVIRTIQMQESSGAHTAADLESEHVIPVERGMLFEVESPSGGDWRASFNPAEISLVNQRVENTPDGGEVKRFTFQGLQKGRFYITLVKSGDSEAGKKSSATEESSLRYTIIVS